MQKLFWDSWDSSLVDFFITCYNGVIIYPAYEFKIKNRKLHLPFFFFFKYIQFSIIILIKYRDLFNIFLDMHG